MDSLHTAVAGLMVIGSVFSIVSTANGAERPGDLDVYLLIGQSNMAGRGTVEPQDVQPHPRVLTLNLADEWAPAVDPIHFDKPSAVGVGPGRTFGIEMAGRDPSRTIGLVPCAVGGSSIRLWRPGAYDAGTRTHPYDDMLRRMQIALNSGTLKGILWHQGESDGRLGLDGSYYPALKELIERLRQTFNAPDVPVVIGQLGRFREWNAGRTAVDAAHRAIARQMPYVGFTSSDGLGDKGDKTHFDAAAARELGKRFAAQMAELQARRHPWGLGQSEQLTPNKQLPDLLTMLDGRAVKTAEEWRTGRRDEVERLMLHYVYGYAPPAPANMTAEVLLSDEEYLDGKATLEVIRLRYGTDCVGPLDVVLAMPNQGTGRCPVILGLNFKGNHTVTDHPGVPLSPYWERLRKDGGIDDEAVAQARGKAKDRWPMELIVRRGYAAATIYQGDLAPDTPDAPTIQSCFYTAGQTKPGPHEWGTLAVWAWGLSRATDYLATCPRIASDRIAVMGHSRNGKAALLAGALDERFALVISNQSGCGGAALSRRRIGETVERINTRFPHWFCDAFKQFNDREDDLPVDQHFLIALAAPRPVLVCSAEGDAWSDPEGEFLGLKAAGPVYELLTGKGVSVDRMPPLNTLTAPPAAYHIRPGKHNVGVEDWTVFMDYADRVYADSDKGK